VTVKRALALAAGATIVSLYALSVAVWAAAAAFIPALRRVVLDPDQMTRGNCHVYGWLKYLNEGGALRIEPSVSYRRIPHSCHLDRRAARRSEFVPDAPYRDWRAWFAGLWFKGHVKRTEKSAELKL
jgi:hypothetical protein